MSLRRGSQRRTAIKVTPTTSSSTSEEGVPKGPKERGEQKDNRTNRGNRNINDQEPSRTATISLNGIENVLNELRPYAATKIKDLPPKAENSYRQAVAFVNLLHDGEYYPALSDLVTRNFSNVGPVEPGTVGAYFVGCLVQNPINTIPVGCSPTCVNSAPPDREQAENVGWSPCERPVILATRINDRYNFSSLNAIQGRGDAIVYIDTDTFNGFTDGEKNNLRQLGVDTVVVIGTQNGQYISEPLLAETPLSTIPPRTITVNRTTNIFEGVPNSNTSGITSSMTWIIIAVIVIILIVLFLLWK